jgi:type II secretory pathway pseudopilin PulG
MNNEKGFSLIEILAVILITTSILVPLLVSLSGNFQVNVRMINKSVATSLTTEALLSFQNMYYQDVEIALNNHDRPFLKFTENEGCDLLRDYSTAPINSFTLYNSNQRVCEYVFEMQAINRSFSDDQFMVIVYPFRVPEDEYTAYIASVNQAYTDGEIPIEVRDRLLTVTSGSSLRILRTIVWIQYGETSGSNVIRTGLLSPEVEVEVE